MSKPQSLQLLVMDEDASLQTFTFQNARVTVGKDDSNLLSLNSTYLSRRHGVFEGSDKGWTYRDLGSTNGTRVLTGDLTEQLGGESARQVVNLFGGETLQVGDSLTITVRLLDDTSQEDEHVVRMVCDANEALSVVPRGGELRLLFETVRAISRCNTDEEILEVIGQAAMQAMPLITHVLFADRDERGRWTVRWSIGREGSAVRSAPGVSKTLLDEARDRGISQLFSTLRPTDPLPVSMVAEQISSSVCVPLQGFEGPLGVVQADCRGNSATLRERELHLMTLLAEQASVMLDRLRINHSIQRMFEGVVNASVKAIESRDPSTAGHSARVADYSLRVARHMHMTESGLFAPVRFGESDLRSLRYAALLHDFGKIAVPSELLLKPRKLSAPAIQQIRDRFRLARMEVRARSAEAKVQVLMSTPGAATSRLEAIDIDARKQDLFLQAELKWLMALMEPGSLAEPDSQRLRGLTKPLHTAGLRLLEPAEVEAMVSCGRGTLTVEERLKVQEHASWTRCYLEEIPWSDELLQVPNIAGDHHEKLNGRGYPRGVGESALPVSVRILTVCDIYDALTDRDRPYRTAMPPAKALGILEREVADGSVDGDVLGVLEGVLSQAGVLS